MIVVAVGIRKAGDKKDIYELMKKLVRTGIVEINGMETGRAKNTSHKE